MSRILQLTSILTFVAITGRSSLAAPPERPPPLTFERHVDYVGWYRKQTEKPGKANAFDELTKLIATLDSKKIKFPGEEYGDEALYYPFDDLARGGIVWKPNDLPIVDTYLSKLDKNLTAFQRTTSILDYWRTLPVNAKRIRGNGRLNSAFSRHAIRALLVQGWKQAPRMSDQLTRAHCAISGHCFQLRQSSDMLNWLLYFSHMQSLCLSVRAALDQHLLSTEDLDRTIDSLTRLGQARMTYDQVLCIEWAEQLDMLQNVFPGGKSDEEHHGKMKKVYGSISFIEVDADPSAILNSVNETFDRLIDIAGGPPARQTWKQMEKHLSGVYPNRNPGEFKYPDVLASMGRGYLLLLEAEAERRATLLCLELHRVHHTSGKWPQWLDELKIADLRTIRIDPFSSRDFKYRIENGGPLLYSVAVDGKDNKATHTGRWENYPDGNVDFVFQPHQEPFRFHFKERNPKTED